MTAFLLICELLGFKLIKDGGATLYTLFFMTGGVAYILQLISAVNLPAGVLFPFSTGGSIVFTAAIATLFFKEKLSKKIIFSTLLCLIGTIMFI